MKSNIRFEEELRPSVLNGRRTKIFYVFSNHSKERERIATIFFYPSWRRYVHGDIPQDIIFSSECDRELADFKEKLTKEWRYNLKNKKITFTQHNMENVVFTKEELIKKIETNKDKTIIFDEYYLLDDDNEKQRDRLNEELAVRFESIKNKRVI
jgi:hypothetical protein